MKYSFLEIEKKWQKYWTENNTIFLPTYKKIINSNNYDYSRIPAWTDRIFFLKNKIRLFNRRMEWLREIDLDKMSAYMRFPTGEFYLYKCTRLK